MNIVIIDSDCKKFFPNAEALQNVLKNQEVSIYEISTVEDRCFLEGCRCILLTSLENGVRNYHRELIMNYPQVRCWAFSILNVRYESEKLQLRENIDMLLAEGKVRYQILFDDEKTLEKTIELCKHTINPAKVCFLISQNDSVALKCRELLVNYLPSWEIVLKNDAKDLQMQYEEADIILAVGSQTEDFILQAPQNCMGRIYIWVEQNYFQSPKEKKKVYEQLIRSGWNLGSQAIIYGSDLQMESYAWKIVQKELSFASLKNIEDFVIWDRYGLPIQAQNYTEEVVEVFMKEHTCFQSMTEKF